MEMAYFGTFGTCFWRFECGRAEIDDTLMQRSRRGSDGDVLRIKLGVSSRIAPLRMRMVPLVNDLRNETKMLLYEEEDSRGILVCEVGEVGEYSSTPLVTER